MAHYQGQAETALQESEGWQKTTQQLLAQLADAAKHAADLDDTQLEVGPLSCWLCMTQLRCPCCERYYHVLSVYTMASGTLRHLQAVATLDHIWSTSPVVLLDRTGHTPYRPRPRQAEPVYCAMVPHVHTPVERHMRLCSQGVISCLFCFSLPPKDAHFCIRTFATPYLLTQL